MQCLYCDAELKPFRGLFDEDFCCRDHRDKYFSSFRKALNRLPEILAAAESVPPALYQAEVHQVEAPVFSADSPEPLAETVDIEQLAPPAAHQPAVHQPAVHQDAEPDAAQVTPPAEIPHETHETPLALATYAVGEPHASSAAGADEDRFGPPAADFLPVALAATAGAQTAHGASLDILAAAYAIELPAGAATWAAALEVEQRPAQLLDPPETTANAFAPIPTSLELSAENPALSTAAPVLPESGECAAHAPFHPEFGYASPWNYADPLPPAPLALALATFAPAADGAAWMPSAEFAEVSLASIPLASSPVAATEITLSHEFHTPVFTPSDGPLLADEDPDEADWAEAGSPAPSEIAPALVMNSAPLDSPALMPARAAEMMPPALSLSSAAAPLHAPGLASTIDAQPALAPELMAEIPQSPAANPPAEPRSHAPLRHFFGSSVRIKNWRLRITFAKPA